MAEESSVAGGRRFLGIEIGGTKLQICAGDANANILECVHFRVDKNAGAQGIRQHLQDAVPDLARFVKAEFVGVGFGGPVDWQHGRICCSHQIDGWSGFELASWISELAEAPVVIDNDANVGALGEARCGAGRGFRTVFYVTLGSGVGGGLVNDGEIYHGSMPGECEIGHVRLDRSGLIVEQRCSGWAVDARLRAAAKANPSGALARCLADAVSGEAKFLNAAVAAGDPDAEKILTETADDLAFALSHVSHLFHPEIIVLGGGLSLVGEPLRAAVAKQLPGYLMEAHKPGPRIALSLLRENAVPVGALILAGAGKRK